VARNLFATGILRDANGDALKTRPDFRDDFTKQYLTSAPSTPHPQ